MALTMDKELLIRLPSALYDKIRLVCGREYKSMSAMVRELLMERLADTISRSEMNEIEKGRAAFRKGKGAAWRKIKRGQV